MGLVVLGPEGEPAAESLMRLLADPTPNVRLAAADTRKHQATLYLRWALLYALDNLGEP